LAGIFFQERRRRDFLFYGVCLAQGILGVCGFGVAAYALCVSDFVKKAINEQIASLTLFDSNSTGGGAVGQAQLSPAPNGIDAITVRRSGHGRDLSFGRSLGMYLTNLYARHRANPVWCVILPSHSWKPNAEHWRRKIAPRAAGFEPGQRKIWRGSKNQLAALIAYGKSLPFIGNRRAGRINPRKSR